MEEPEFLRIWLQITLDTRTQKKQHRTEQNPVAAPLTWFCDFKEDMQPETVFSPVEWK